MSGTDKPQLWPVLIIARPDEFTKSLRLVVTPTNTWPSWLLGSTVDATRRTLPSTSPAPTILTRAGWLTASFERYSVGTWPTRSNSLRAMMENSASPRAEATAPITAVELAIRPATGACTTTLPPSGRLSRASVWPAVTLSPASAMISATFSPCPLRADHGLLARDDDAVGLDDGRKAELRRLQHRDGGAPRAILRHVEIVGGEGGGGEGEA